jgi:hypothetical protein
MTEAEPLPTETISTPWLYEDDGRTEERDDVGKWMLFYDNDIMDTRWADFKTLYRQNQLPGVISMKCSTAMKNPRASNANSVILFYCNNSGDENTIMNIGKNIVSHADIHPWYYTYYKSDEQTRLGTRATGVKKNWLYRTRV